MMVEPFEEDEDEPSLSTGEPGEERGGVLRARATTASRVSICAARDRQ